MGKKGVGNIKYGQERENKQGGGVMILVKKELAVEDVTYGEGEQRY